MTKKFSRKELALMESQMFEGKPSVDSQLSSSEPNYSGDVSGGEDFFEAPGRKMPSLLDNLQAGQNTLELQNQVLVLRIERLEQGLNTVIDKLSRIKGLNG